MNKSKNINTILAIFLMSQETWNILPIHIAAMTYK